MAIPDQLTRRDIERFLEGAFDEDPLGFAAALGIIDGWLLRGDGVAVYRNEDIGHPDMGMLKFVSYGSGDAQLPLRKGLTYPPRRLPDIGATINWRYWLLGVYREEEEG